MMECGVLYFINCAVAEEPFEVDCVFMALESRQIPVFRVRYVAKTQRRHDSMQCYGFHEVLKNHQKELVFKMGRRARSFPY